MSDKPAAPGPWTVADSPAEIWLEPQCAENGDEGRTWGDKDAFDDTCDECGSPAVRYVRADMAAARVAALEEALRWAFPLAQRAMEDVATTRARAGHTGLGTIRSSLYDDEVRKMDSIRALLDAKP